MKGKKGTDMSRQEPKYKTLAELKAAYENGELDPEASPLMLDNDNSTVYTDEGCVYRGPGYEIREEALTLLGIPWEFV
jgi:hypothetical protein